MTLQSKRQQLAIENLAKRVKIAQITQQNPHAGLLLA